MIPVLGQRVELEILGGCPPSPRAWPWAQGAEHHFPCVLLVVGAFFGDAQDGQVEVDPGTGFGE